MARSPTSQSTAQSSLVIGDVRVRFKCYDPSATHMTALGQNNNGQIALWTAPDSWLCSGFMLGTLRPGTLDKETLFAQLLAEANALTWVLCFLRFVLFWCAFCCMGGPLELVTDCIPCIGPCLEDSIACITSCISCLPACACAHGVVGIVWVATRPAVGLPLFYTCGGLVGFKVYGAEAVESPERATSHDGDPLLGDEARLTL